MDLARDLLVQARHLAELDPGKPKQANLRCAVSSAYYALFHLLVAEFVHKVLPGRQKALMDRVGRSFNHADMLRVCRQWQQPVLPQGIRDLLENAPDARFTAIAKTFVDLQEARHEADYDVSVRLSRSATLARVRDVELAFANWKTIRNSDQAIPFLVSLAFGGRWNR